MLCLLTIAFSILLPSPGRLEWGESFAHTRTRSWSINVEMVNNLNICGHFSKLNSYVHSTLHERWKKCIQTRRIIWVFWSLWRPLKTFHWSITWKWMFSFLWSNTFQKCWATCHKSALSIRSAHDSEFVVSTKPDMRMVRWRLSLESMYPGVFVLNPHGAYQSADILFSITAKLKLILGKCFKQFH